MEAIKIKNLTFKYPTETANALSDINLTVNRGEFIVLCGKSGCGKSTLLKLLKPPVLPVGEKSGEIFFEGKSITELTEREQAQKIGFVRQDPDLQIVCDKVWHELAFGLENLSYSNTEIRTRTAEVASFFGINNWFYKNTNELSGGQKQLLNVASVMVMQPSIIILDEPTSQLDPITAYDFLHMLYKINRELGTTVIISEHRLEDAFPLADRVAVLDKGKIIAYDTPQKTAKSLFELKNDMFCALPIAMRVYCNAEKESGIEYNNIPITVRDGKKWLLKKNIDDGFKIDPDKPLSNNTALEVKNVCFRYDKNSPDILKNLSFKVKRGEFYAIAGANGAGKTTAVSVIAGLLKPYTGSVFTNSKKIIVLPQNPQTVFCQKTVYDELKNAICNTENNKINTQQKIENIAKLCEISGVLKNHPYDLSGGEAQRAALAIVLLKNPDIIILDEPTKGLDAHFKIKLANILKSLCKSGITIITVSHDIEFCAECADRCAMFFDGQIVSQDATRPFFAGNSYYTTAVNRMARDIIPNAVKESDLSAALHIEQRKTDIKQFKADIQNTNICTQNLTNNLENNKNSKKITFLNMAAALVFFVLFAVTQFKFVSEYTDWKDIVFQIAAIIFLGGALLNIIPQKEYINFAENEPFKERLTQKSRLALIITLIIIPLTIFTGVYYLKDRKYHFISLLIIFETLTAFMCAFEDKKPHARELVIISVLCACAVAGRAAFAPLPQFKPVVAAVIITGICFGGETGFLTGAVTGFVSNFFFGQGPWTPWQMFSFGAVGLIAGIMYQNKLIKRTKSGLCIFGFLATVIVYGGIMNPASVIIWQPKPTKAMFISAYIMGLPFDIIHGLATAFFLWFGAQPLIEKIERVKIKYGLKKCKI